MHAGGAVLPVAAQDPVVDLLPTGRLHVDVDVGEVVADRVDEPLEQEAVMDRVDLGDAVA